MSRSNKKGSIRLWLIYYHYKKHIPLILINLTPLIPLSLRRRGGKSFREKAKPPSLIYTPPSLYKIKNTKWEFKRGRAPLH